MRSYQRVYKERGAIQLFRKKCEAKLEKSQSRLKGPVRGAVAQAVGWNGDVGRPNRD